VPRGTETFLRRAARNLRLFAHTVIDAGRPWCSGMGRMWFAVWRGTKGKLIAYSLGNFATYGKFGLRGRPRFL
jgi:hypothetical protein